MENYDDDDDDIPLSEWIQTQGIGNFEEASTRI